MIIVFKRPKEKLIVGKKLISFCLSCVLLLSAMPTSAFAGTDVLRSEDALSEEASQQSETSEIEKEADVVAENKRADEVPDAGFTEPSVAESDDSGEETAATHVDSTPIEATKSDAVEVNETTLENVSEDAVLASVVIEPNASRPTWTSEWPGYANSGAGSATTTANTPTSSAKESWTFDYKAYVQAQYPNASEPVLAGSFAYLAVDNLLLKIDKSNGSVVKSAELASKVGYTARPVYTNGIVIVPLDAGRVQALTADELKTVWITSKVSDIAQMNSTLTVDGDYVYVGTVDTDYVNYNNGYFTKIKTTTGSIVWQTHDDNEGYYWDGACIKGNYVIISTSAGTVKCINKDTGVVTSSLALGKIVNSDCVLSEDGSKIYLMSRDGKLNVIVTDLNGTVSIERVVDLGFSGCACTPTISGGKMFVGGEVNGGQGSALAIVDLSTFNVQLVENADGSAFAGGGIKGAPLVSTNSAGTYVYFTVNNAETTDWVNYTAGGGVYSYKLGDGEAKLIYDAKGHNQYCDSPVICDAEGNLYYINDSGTLFKLKKVSGSEGTKDNDGSTVNNDTDNSSTKSDHKNKHHAQGKSDKKSNKSKDSKTSKDKKDNKEDKSDKEKDGKSKDKKPESSKTKEDMPATTQVADNGQDESIDQTVNYLPIAGIALGVGIAICAICYLLKLRKDK